MPQIHYKTHPKDKNSSKDFHSCQILSFGRDLKFPQAKKCCWTQKTDVTIFHSNEKTGLIKKEGVEWITYLITKSFHFWGCTGKGDFHIMRVTGRSTVGVTTSPYILPLCWPGEECVSCCFVPLRVVYAGVHVCTHLYGRCFRSHSTARRRSGEIESGSWFLEKWRAATCHTNALTHKRQAQRVICADLTHILIFPTVCLFSPFQSTFPLLCLFARY